MALGITLPGIFVKSTSSADEIIQFFRLEAMIATVPFILLVIFYREKPEHPPSKAAQALNIAPTNNYMDILKDLFTNREYLKLCFTLVLNYGVGMGFISSLEQALVGIGYENSSQVISICGSSGIIFGVVANILYSYLIKKTKQYKKVIVAGMYVLI
jgi:MFS transporter, FLVCR family, feline leukemia virus subgroup C receptor-related protein